VLALEKLQSRAAIMRGTLQASFLFKPFDHCRRLGLSVEIETAVLDDVRAENQARQASQGLQTSPSPTTGMLVVETTIPGGVSKNVLLSGDIVLAINGKTIVSFVGLEGCLDENVGREVTLEVFRQTTDASAAAEPSPGSPGSADSSRKKVVMKVADLCQLGPTAYASLCGGLFHELPYSFTKMWNIERKGVFVAARGFIFGVSLIQHAVIVKINNMDVHTLPDFVKAIRSLRHREYFRIEWKTVKVSERATRSSICLMEKELAAELGFWELQRRDTAGAPDDWRKVTEEDMVRRICPLAEGTKIAQPPKGLKDMTELWTNQKLPKWATKVLPYLVFLECRTPIGPEIIDHRPSDTIVGNGLVIDITEDEVVIVSDREGVPVEMCMVTVNFGKAVKCFGTVRFIHPIHNIVIITCKVKDLGDFPLIGRKMPPLMWRETAVHPGDTVKLLGLNMSSDLVCQESKIASYFTPKYALMYPPLWRERNIQGLLLQDASSSLGGIICDENGLLVGLYAQFTSQTSLGGHKVENAIIPLHYVQPLLPSLSRRLGLSPSVLSGAAAATGSSSSGEGGHDHSRDNGDVDMNDAATGKRKAPTAGAGGDANEEVVLQSVPALQCEVEGISLEDAVTHKVPETWIHRLRKASTTKLQMVAISRLQKQGCAELAGLKVGDILLAVNGHTVTNEVDVERQLYKWHAYSKGGAGGTPSRSGSRKSARVKPGAAAASEATTRWSVDTIECTVFSKLDAKEVTIIVTPSLLGSDTTTDIISWNGMCLLKTPRPVLERNAEFDMDGVYCSGSAIGSPGETHGMGNNFRLLEINSKPINTMEDMVGVMQENAARLKSLSKSLQNEDGEDIYTHAYNYTNSLWIRVRTRDLQGKEHAKTLLANDKFFPGVRIRKNKATGIFHTEVFS
jgi:S1-C subfamily serine protease